MGRILVASISKKALQHNLKCVRSAAPQAKVIAMVKANGYGHGLIEVSKALSDVDALGVACIEEAILMRRAGIKTDIFVMEGFFTKEELPAVEAHNLTLVVHSDYQFELLKDKTFSNKIRVWIKLNCGMNRLGYPIQRAKEAYQLLAHNNSLEIVGFMGHFAQADEKSNPVSFEQYKAFVKATQGLPGARSMANSAGILGWQLSHCDYVRPGLMLYGASPFPGTTGRDFGLIPAMELSSQIIAIQDLMPGDKVGYGGTYTCDKPTRIGIVAVGYGDGYPWHASNDTPVSINGQRAGLVGRVSMDMIAVDITNIPEARIGDRAVLWGGDLPVEQVAKYSGTIAYELFCRLTERVKILWQV